MRTCLQHYLLVRPLQRHAPLAQQDVHGSKLPFLAVERRAHRLIHRQKAMPLRRRGALSCGEPLPLCCELSVCTLLLVQPALLGLKRSLQRVDGLRLRGRGAGRTPAAAHGQPELLLELLLRGGHLPELIREPEAVRPLLVQPAPQLRSLCATAVALAL
jgi:hypothetical protein